jgi:hypothetical protein
MCCLFKEALATILTKKILCFGNWQIDQEMDAILLIIDIVYWVCQIVIKSVQQCTYFLFSVNLLLVGVNYGQRIMKVLVNSFKMMK